MRILIDVMSGDNAPEELLRGAVEAAESFNVDIAVCGNAEVIDAVAREKELDLSPITVFHAPQVIGMEDSALCVVREKSDSSMALGLHMLAEGKADAFVSAGNTGALVAGATLIVRKIKGVRRAAIGTVLPFTPPFLLLDAGANPEITPDDAVQFALLGSVYAEKMLGRSKARVGLLNNGAEATKGGEKRVETYKLLSEHGEIDFVGNVESREIPYSPCDVLVTDGFSGNIVLKLCEGLGSYMFSRLKETMTQDLVTKASALIMKPKLKKLKTEFSASEYGGAPLLGISKPVIKAHGSSDARAIKNAVRQAMTVVSAGVIPEMARYAAKKQDKPTEEGKEG
ncbi:MAG: phosphate acyltransferase PlsX [Clostridia bacterium]|nr:phosphate acyltransferase PlsX [Clostridia bacterium]